MSTRVIIGVVAVVVAVCCVLAAIAVAGGALFLGWVSEEPEGIEVVVNAPMKVHIDEPFSIEVRVQNVANVSQSV